VTLTTRACSFLGAISASCALLAACMPTDGAPVPPPPDSKSAVSATPPETAQEREERLAYEAAEKAYRTFAAEYARLQQQVEGPNRPTRLMTENAAGPYLKSMSDFLRYKAKHGRHVDKAVRIAYVHHGGYSKEELILLTCQDGSKVRVFNKSGKQVGRGSVSKLTLHARPVSGRWKIWSATQEVAKSCVD
jgi:hypothetical protein